MDAIRFREVQEEADLGRAHLAFLVVPGLLSVYLWTRLALPWSLVAVALLWVLAVYFGLKTLGLMPTRTNEMRLDPGGIELDYEQGPTRLRWEDITRLAVMRLPSKKTPRWYLVAWLEPGVKLPTDPKGAMPVFDATIGAFRLCDIRSWDYTEAEITMVLQQYAGETWKPVEKAS